MELTSIFLECFPDQPVLLYWHFVILQTQFTPVNFFLIIERYIFQLLMSKHDQIPRFSKISRDGAFYGKMEFDFKLDRSATKCFGIPESGLG